MNKSPFAYCKVAMLAAPVKHSRHKMNTKAVLSIALVLIQAVLALGSVTSSTDVQAKPTKNNQPSASVYSVDSPNPDVIEPTVRAGPLKISLLIVAAVILLTIAGFTVFFSMFEKSPGDDGWCGTGTGRLDTRVGFAWVSSAKFFVVGGISALAILFTFKMFTSDAIELTPFLIALAMFAVPLIAAAVYGAAMGPSPVYGIAFFIAGLWPWLLMLYILNPIKNVDIVVPVLIFTLLLVPVFLANILPVLPAQDDYERGRTMIRLKGIYGPFW